MPPSVSLPLTGIPDLSRFADGADLILPQNLGSTSGTFFLPAES